LLVLAPEPEGRDLPQQNPFAQTGSVTAGSGVRVLQRADDEVFVTGALRGGQAVITGRLRCAAEGVRVRTETDPVR